MGYLQEYIARCPEDMLYLDCLEACAARARLYHSRRMHNKDHLKTEYIGTVRRGAWMVDVYEDREGNYWTDDRVAVGKWVITGLEMVSGQKEPDNTFWRHTGRESDWDKLYEEYGGIPPNWEHLAGEEQEGESGGDYDYAVNAAEFERTEEYKRAV